jgi:uncharacterized protein (UPF0303 family)
VPWDGAHPGAKGCDCKKKDIGMTAEELASELAPLTLKHFSETVALRLGAILMAIAEAEKMPVVINIRSANRTYFHAGLPGSTAVNDNWARRKSNLALYAAEASMIATLRFQARGRTLAIEGLSEADYAISGGAVPIVVESAGPVAVCTVSGLPQEADHALVVRGLRALRAEMA